MKASRADYIMLFPISFFFRSLFSYLIIINVLPQVTSTDEAIFYLFIYLFTAVYNTILSPMHIPSTYSIVYIRNLATSRPPYVPFTRILYWSGTILILFSSNVMKTMLYRNVKMC